MEMEPDKERLRALFSEPGLRWVMDRLCERISHGRALNGTIGNAQASADERRALDDLLGRRSTGGSRISLELSRLEQILQDARMATSLEEAVQVCRGPIENRKVLQELRRDAWQTMFSDARSIYVGRPDLLVWLEGLAREGTLKRLSRGNVETASGLLSTAWPVLSRDSSEEILLATLAAKCAGDSHALDRGQPLATLCLRAIAALHGVDGLTSANARREAWATMGVLIDDLSAPVLTFNLSASPGSSLAPLLAMYREQQQPAFLTYRQLQQGGPFNSLGSELRMRTVYVCENPSVVSAAAIELGTNCLPLICTNGQPSSAVQLLLAQIRRAGSEIFCHTDFDWAGLRIADQLIRRYEAKPWRMTVEEYCSASGTVPLEARPFIAPWAPALSEVMREKGVAIYEEQMVRNLLTDLQSLS